MEKRKNRKMPISIRYGKNYALQGFNFVDGIKWNIVVPMLDWVVWWSGIGWNWSWKVTGYFLI